MFIWLSQSHTGICIVSVQSQVIDLAGLFLWMANAVGTNFQLGLPTAKKVMCTQYVQLETQNICHFIYLNNIYVEILRMCVITKDLFRYLLARYCNSRV